MGPRGSVPARRLYLPSLAYVRVESVSSALRSVCRKAPVPAPSVVHAAESWRAQGFQVPPWESLLGGQRPPAAPEPRDTLRGWQCAAVACQDRTACESLLSDLDPASSALLLSQASPGLSLLSPQHLSSACRVSACASHCSVACERPYPTHCRRGGALDVWGDHRTACPTAGVLGPHGTPPEQAAARMCREAGAGWPRTSSFAT